MCVRGNLKTVPRPGVCEMFEQRPNLIAFRALMVAACLALVAGCGGGGEQAAAGAPAAAGTPAPAPVVQAPVAPTGLVATPGNAQVSLAWSASSNATSYDVKRATASGGPYAQLGTAVSTSYMDATVVNGATYFYVVAAVNSQGASAASAPASVTPAAVPPAVVPPAVVPPVVATPTPTPTPAPTPPPVDQTKWPTGDPGCGLSAAAFCDTFDAPATAPFGRSNELNANRWSLARNAPDLGKADEIGRAVIAQCRSDVPGVVYPPGDTRICFGNDGIQSNYLLTATAAQNYGSNAYRIRQPFDFAGRMGKIVFDADATAIGLLGWIAIAVTEDPIPSPSFSNIPGFENFEGGVIPKNGLTVELEGTCNPDEVRVDMIHEYRNYVDYDHDFAFGQSTCFQTSHHHLNRFELRISQTRVELWATPYSADGVHFGALSLVASANLGLTFTRGYVQLVARNHATKKYWTASNPADAQDAWVVSWDNVGFDGPVVNNTREFEVPDALVPTSLGVAMGYFLTDASTAQKTTVTIHGVTGAAQAVRARLAMNVHYWGNFTNVGLSTWALVYRLNGKAWHTYNLSPAEQALFNSGVVFQGDKAGKANSLSQGVLGHVFDVPLTDLVEGDNILEIATSNVPFAGYPPTLSNVDLILTNP
jgi:hypothetical protein